jgi:histone deacetylase complex regulatory component SIN3
MNNELTVKQYR